MNPKPVRLAACLLARLLIEKSKVSILSVLDETISQLYKTLKRYRDDFLEDEDIREKSALGGFHFRWLKVSVIEIGKAA